MGYLKYVHLLFFAGGLLVAYLLTQTTEWVWSYFAKPKDVYATLIGIVGAAVVTFSLWKNKNLFEKASNIINELLKVTWPTRRETWAATVVVIVTVIVFSIILGLFDLAWSWASGLIYS